MRLGSLEKRLVGLVAVAFAAACTASTAEIPPGAGTDVAATEPPSSAHGHVDGTPTSGGHDASSSSGGVVPSLSFKPLLLKSGDVTLSGIAGDHVVYIAKVGTTRTLEAVPLAGGTPIVIGQLAATDRVVVRGGAVAWYSNVDPQSGLSRLNLWTTAGGLVPNVTSSALLGFFTASVDGTRVAFSVNASTTSTSLAVTSSVKPSAAAVLSGNFAINLASEECSPDISFVGTTLVGAYCTGTSPTAVRAKLVTVDASSNTPRQLVDNASDAGAIQAFWTTDKTGSKFFVIGLASGASPAQGRVVTNGAQPVVTAFDTGVEDGFVLDDGSAIVYRTGGALKKIGTTTPTPSAPSLLTSSLQGLIDVSKDGSEVLFHALEPAGDDELVDLRSIEVATAALHDLVVTPTVVPVGFTADAKNVVFLSNMAKGRAEVHAVAAAGGAPALLQKDAFGAVLPPSGSGVFVLENPQTVGQSEALTVDVRYFDLAQNQMAMVADHVLTDAGYRFSDKALVFSRVTPAASGLYVVNLP